MPRRVCNAKVRRVIDWLPAEPHSRAYKKKPFSGKRVRQTLSNGETIEGRLLVGQCRARTSSGRRCKKVTSYDYQWCTTHLLRQWYLMVAPSRVPGAGLGVYAVREDELKRLGKDDKGRPNLSTNCVVFEKDSFIGNGFGGELLSLEDDRERYGSEGAAYILTWYIEGREGPGVIDGFLARTVSSYCNDAINLEDVPNWRFKNNAHWRGDRLIAIRPILHGHEILWPYGRNYWSDRVKTPSDSLDTLPSDPLQ